MPCRTGASGAPERAATVGRTIGIIVLLAIIVLAIGSLWSGPMEPDAKPAPEQKPTEQVGPLQINMDAAGKGKLGIKDLVVGKGPMPKAGQTVEVQYTGRLTDGTKFDSSYDSGRPYSFVLGEGNVIEGWDEGLKTMRVGGKRQLTVPPSLGYGPAGTPDGKIPPNSTLIFDIELLSVR